MADDVNIDALLAAGPADQRAALELVVALFRKQIEDLREQNDKLLHELQEMRRLLFGRKSEKQPDARRGARRRAQAAKPAKEREAERVARRKRGREQREALPTDERELDVPEEDRVCPACGSTDLKPLGSGVTSTQIEHVVEHLVRLVWTRRRYACACGKGIVTAKAPPQVSEGCEYGPGLHAHVAVSKCGDALPLYRQSKRMKRAGLTLSRATLCSLFHRSADSLTPIYNRMLALLRQEPHVSADETPLPVLAKGGCKRGYVWTFVGGPIVAFTYSASRGGKTPVEILGESDGVLLADGYSGYNAATGDQGRVRAGCWAHVRRGFFRALQSAPNAAGTAMDQIAKLYDVEHRAVELGIVGTVAHRSLRQEDAKPVVDSFFAWLEDQVAQHPPKSPMGKAIGYAQNQQDALQVFLDDAGVALDNNASERALKPVALGRKNFLFAGHDDGAANLAKLQTIVATCQHHGVNAHNYIEDVLVRVHTHPAKQLDELLPWNWPKLDTG